MTFSIAQLVTILIEYHLNVAATMSGVSQISATSAYLLLLAARNQPRVGWVALLRRIHMLGIPEEGEQDVSGS